MFESAEAAFGGVDVLVNNGGIMKRASIAESDDSQFDNQIAVKLKGGQPACFTASIMENKL